MSANNLQPETAETCNNRGMAKLKSNDLDGALVDFDKAIELKPTLWQAFHNRSVVKKAKGDLTGSQADSDKALDLKPDSPEVCYSRAMRHMRKSDWNGAISHFNRAIELNPAFAEAYGNRGAAKNAAGDSAGALFDLQKAIELKPDSPGFKEVLRVMSKKGKSHSKTSVEMRKKKIPITENALVLRTDFSDEVAWKAVCTSIKEAGGEFQAQVEIVDDPNFERITADQLATSFASEATPSFAFIVDKLTLTNLVQPILVVDLQNESARTFRVTPAALWAVENNLSIGNMEFEEFATAVEADGIFRGFN
jgi:tetratricopeptide (TPR) repeat protein